MRIMPATPPPSCPSLPNQSQPSSTQFPDNTHTHVNENGEIPTDQNHAPLSTTPDQQDFSTNPQDLRVPPQNPPTHSNTPSPSHTNSGRPSPNYLRGSSEFPPWGSPVPPGTNLSTDYSSVESIDEACAEHAERLLKIVTPPELGEESEGEGTEVGSVNVSECGLERTLRLRGERDGEGEDTLTPADCEKARQDASEETESVESQPNTLPISAASAFRTPDKSRSGTTQGTPPPDSPFSLSCLGLPTTPITPTAAPPQLEGPMSWWAEALAETENMEDIDALVEQLEGTARGSSSVGGKDGEENKKEVKKGEKKYEKERMMKVQEGEEARKKTEETDVTLTQNKAGATGSAEENVSSITDERRGGEERSVVPATEKSGANSAEDQEVSSASAVSANLASHDQSVVTETTPLTSRSPSPSTGSAHSEEVAYIVQAGRLVRKALQYEQEREYEEAFDLFKAAVDVLLNGVQSEEEECLSRDCHVTK